MNKRGLEGNLTNTIIWIIATILLLVIGMMIYTNYSQKTPEEACRASVVIQANTKIGGKSPFDFNCQRKFVTMGTNQVKTSYIAGQEGNPESIQTDTGKISKYPSATNDVVNYVIANEMQKCWYMFGEGNVDVFQNKVFADYNACFICAEVRFNTDVPKTEFHGLLEFMKTHNIANQKESYQAYLTSGQQPYKPWSDLVAESSDTYNSISTEDTQYIVFIKNVPWILVRDWSIQLGKNKNSYYVVMYNDTSINYHCSFIAN